MARLFNCVGPRQTGAYGMVVPTFFRQALLGQPVTVYGTASRSLLLPRRRYRRRRSLSLLDEPRAVGDVFNVGAPHEITMNALAERVIEMTGSPSAVVHVPYETAYEEGFEDMERRVPDVSKIEALTGWSPTRSLDDILRDVLAFERARPERRAGPNDLNTGLPLRPGIPGPLVGALVFTPLLGRLAGRAGIVDHPKKDRFHSRATPYLGGVAIAAGLLLVVMLVPGEPDQVAAVVVGALVLGGLGLVDDVRGGLGPAVKLVLEAAAGAGRWAVGIRAGIFDVAALDFALTVAWVVVVTNAVNLLDNMDGVAAGVVAVAATGMFAIAADQGDYLVASLALAVAGGCLGFLRYNFSPASIFMGDAGTLFLGFLLAALGMKLDLVGPGTLARAVIPVLAVGVPLFDMALVILSRASSGRSIYRGGTDHSAHRLAVRGVRTRRIAITAYVAQVACSIAAYLLVGSAADTTEGSLVVAVVLATALLGVFLRMRTASDEGSVSSERSVLS